MMRTPRETQTTSQSETQRLWQTRTESDTRGWPDVVRWWWDVVPLHFRKQLVFPAELGCIPCVRAGQENSIPLFWIFAVLEEQLDLEAARAELPQVTAGDLYCALRTIDSALRANSADVRIEDLIDEYGYTREMLDQLRERVETDATETEVNGSPKVSLTGPSKAKRHQRPWEFISTKAGR